MGKVCLFVSLSSCFVSFFSLHLSISTVLFFAVFENFFIFLKIICLFIYMFVPGFVCMSVCLYVCLFVHLFVSMSTHVLFMWLFVHMFVLGFVCISLCMSVFLFIYLYFFYVCTSLCLFVYLSVFRSFCLSLCMSISLFLNLSACLYVFLFICLSIYLFVFLLPANVLVLSSVKNFGQTWIIFDGGVAILWTKLLTSFQNNWFLTFVFNFKDIFRVFCTMHYIFCEITQEIV